jgi:FtsH-binding integral membrane protein
MKKASSSRTLWQIFAAPLAVAIITAAGLVAALMGDGIWDALSWIALGIPLATLAVFIFLSWRNSPARQGRQ